MSSSSSLQVLSGEVNEAIDNHKIHVLLAEKYGFIPEGFTSVCINDNYDDDDDVDVDVVVAVL